MKLKSVSSTGSSDKCIMYSSGNSSIIMYDWLCFKGLVMLQRKSSKSFFFSLLHNYAKGLEQSMIGPGFIFDCFGNLLCSIK